MMSAASCQTLASINRRTLLAGHVSPRILGISHRSNIKASPVDSDLQSLLARFDRDGDGQLTYAETIEAFAAMQARQLPATQPAKAAAPAPAPAKPVSPQAAPATWDLQVVNGLRDAQSRGQSPLSALLAFMGAKLRNRSKARASASDLLWSFVGMFLAVTALGVMNSSVRTWPVVGEWHQQGLGLLLGSFGTLCVLIFGRPEAEAVRVWNLLAGHVIATATVLTLLHVLGPGVLSRALAMACMIASMLFTDSVHPPGGALVLMAVDSAAIQRIDWWFMLYPSLAVTIALLLPLGVAINWLKRNVMFDFPPAASTSASEPAPSGLRPKAA
ncbi:hypothetical protein PLESTB_000217900 [Pleodorina starrii]|uniref:EF-hand domain-containing protein n=1 Tax=Pleodorina starrii TaxID=330485 RepID=A0A9W6EYT9_9CHLO|nr:hypothetical protein PLESTM_001543600 [Pleodorina starrii]GLC49426.1 hypothetical protein PLESTB_000217900 [Pleodorina starrii]GLC75658.1 hypothetical protein PLESTF_001670900 [Pleodorina starrii]